jgi:hypothetical protein
MVRTWRQPPSLQQGVSNIASSQCYISELNIDCPLLSLPAELLDKIYEHVFGNHWLHVSRDGRSVKLCWRPDRFLMRRDVIKSSPTRQRFVPAFAFHYECHVDRDCFPGSMAIPLEFLRTCQKVYSAANLLPFSANTFVFQRCSVVERFYEHHGRERGLAMKSVLLEYLLDVDHESHGLLTKVKNITVFALLFDRADFRSGMHSHTHMFTSLREKKSRFMSADVCLEYCGTSRVGDWDFRRAEADIEQYLMGSPLLSERTCKLLS